MADILEEVETMVNCKTCKWNQFCIKPPVMTWQEVQTTLRAMERDAREEFDNPEDAGFGMLMGTMMFLGKDKVCQVCPGLARRMDESVLSQKIKELMQDSKEALPQCKACGWEKFCLEPPTMTEEEEKTKIKGPGNQDDDPRKSLTKTLVGSLLFGGKATECSACPVFIEKLKESPNLAQQIKKIMRSWESNPKSLDT